MTTIDPLSLDRFIVRHDVDNGHVVIADRDLTPLTGTVADSILRERDAVVIWYTSDRLGHVVFPVTDAGWSMAQALADQLNTLDAASDAEQAAALIDSAASLAEAIDAADADAGRRQRAIAAYQRAADLPPYPWPSGCSNQYLPGDRVRIGDPDDEYRCGVMVGLRLPAQMQGQTGTVILPHRPGCPLIVLLDSNDVVELPCSGLYVRRAE